MTINFPSLQALQTPQDDVPWEIELPQAWLLQWVFLNFAVHRLNTFPFNPRQVNRNHYCSSLASKGFLLPLLSSMVIILLQCIAGYGGGLPQKLHLTLVSPLAVVVVNTSTPVGGDVSIVTMHHWFVIICHHQCLLNGHCQHFNSCWGRCQYCHWCDHNCCQQSSILTFVIIW